jgi:hypothetical protein
MEKNDDWLIGKLTVFRHNHDYDWIMDRVKEWAAAREVARAACESTRDAVNAVNAGGARAASQAAAYAERSASWAAARAAQEAEFRRIVS